MYKDILYFRNWEVKWSYWNLECIWNL